MASISTDPRTGRRTIQFIAPDGKHKSVRVGKVAQRLADTVKLRVEHLVAAAASNCPIDAETARWVGELGQELADLTTIGLSHVVFDPTPDASGNVVPVFRSIIDLQ